MVIADRDEAPFLPDTGLLCQGASHPHAEVLTEVVGVEEPETSEQTSFGHRLSKVDFFRTAMHWFCSQAWLWSANLIGKSEEFRDMFS